MRFLELLKGHRGELVLVNADQVELVLPEPNGTSVCLIGGRSVVVRNTPAEILEMLEQLDSDPPRDAGIESQSTSEGDDAESLGQIRSLGA